MRIYQSWQGDQIAQTTNDRELLEVAVRLDSTLDRVHSRLAFFYLYDPFSYSPSRAVEHFRKAVSLRPSVFLRWTDLARGYEGVGDMVSADRAYQRGIEVAPHYFYAHWAYGNFLLRQQRTEDSFRELRRAADIHPSAISNICNLILQTTGGDVRVLEKFGASLISEDSKAGICRCLAQKKEFRSALTIWQALKKDSLPKIDAGHLLFSNLTEAKQWELAHQVWRDLVRIRMGPSGQVSESDLAFWNRGFEFTEPVGGFDWNFIKSTDVESQVDSQVKYDGNRSLRIRFKEHKRVQFSGVFHNLWVEPSSGYRLSFYYRSQGLSENNGLLVVVTDLEDQSRLTVDCGPLTDQESWTRREMVFETPPETRVIRVSLVRRPTEKVFDYVEGTVWFDGFALERR
jgi:hypothetical protein